MRSKVRAFLLIVFFIASGFSLSACNDDQISGAKAADSDSSYTIESAKVEEVLEAKDNGFSFRAYVVAWKGARIVLDENPFGPQPRVGDTVKFIAKRLVLEDKTKLLRFSIVD